MRLSCTVNGILNIKYWRNLGLGVLQGHRQIIYDFVLVCRCNYNSILHHFLVI